MNVRFHTVLPALVFAVLIIGWSNPAHAQENQCPPEVMDCGCGTDPSCPGVDLSEYYIDDSCDPEVDPSCDQLAGDVAADAYARCGSVAQTAQFRLCYWGCRDRYKDVKDTCDSWLMIIGGGRAACLSEAARDYNNCVGSCAIDYCG